MLRDPKDLTQVELVQVVKSIQTCLQEAHGFSVSNSDEAATRDLATYDAIQTIMEEAHLD